MAIPSIGPPLICRSGLSLRYRRIPRPDVFFLLTDVGLSNGPHIYVLGSHVKKPLKHLVSIYKGRSDAEIETCYGLERQDTLCGPARFGFAEDVFDFHKGLHPERGDRLIFQLRYGLRDNEISGAGCAS
jgi:hypothetical protein